MQYSTGENIFVGDTILIEHGKTQGKIKNIIDSAETLAEWGIHQSNSFGVIVEAEPFGLVFWSVPDEHDPIQFIRHSN
jgi:hypothetical protein